MVTSRTDNDALTQIDRGTPMGDLMRLLLDAGPLGIGVARARLPSRQGPTAG